MLRVYKLTLNNIIAFVLFRHVCMTWLSRNYCVKETRMNAKLNHRHRHYVRHFALSATSVSYVCLWSSHRTGYV